MRIALFGGTGFVGSYLIDALVPAGHELSLLVRPGSDRKLRNPGCLRLVAGDLSSETAINATIENCDAVIFCVGILRENRRQGITFEGLQYAALVRVAKAAKAQGISRFLLMSANGVKIPGTPYQETKYRAEQYISDAGFDFTVFRPSVIFGDPKGAMEFATQIYRDMVSKPFPAVGFFTGWNPRWGTVPMSPVHAEDVALAFTRSLEDPSTIGKTYVLGGPEKLSWSEMVRRIGDAAGKSKCIMPMPVRLMKLAATIFDWLPFFPVTRDQLSMLTEGNVASPAQLEALIGRAPKKFSSENLSYLRADS